MEGPEMQTALDDIPFQHAVCEIGEGMRTASFGRIEGSTNVVQGDELVTNLEGLHCAWRNIRSGTDRDEVFCHDPTEWSETFLISGLPEKFNSPAAFTLVRNGAF